MSRARRLHSLLRQRAAGVGCTLLGVAVVVAGWLVFAHSDRHEQSTEPTPLQSRVTGTTAAGTAGTAGSAPVAWGDHSRRAMRRELAAAIAAGRSADVNALLLRLLDEDAPAAVRAAFTIPSHLLDESSARRVIALLERRDRVRAADFALRLPPGALQGELLGQVLPRWAVRDWAGVEAWARALADDEPGKQTALVHLFHRWAEVDLVRLLDYAAHLPPGFQQFQSLVAHRLAVEAPDLALEWAQLVSSAAARGRAVAAAATTWAVRDPVAAAHRAANLHGAPRRSAVLAVLSTWGARDPFAALAWAETLPERF